MALTYVHISAVKKNNDNSRLKTGRNYFDNGNNPS